MNVMFDAWTVFGRDQGQMVQVAYRCTENHIIRRMIDRCDRTVRFDSAVMPDGVEWNGSEGNTPFCSLEFKNCTNPFWQDDTPYYETR